MSRAQELAAAAADFETHDYSELMQTGGTWVEADPGYDPKAEAASAMVVYSVRMPQPMLQALREQAQRADLGTGELIRSWLEDRLAAGDPDADQRALKTLRTIVPQLDLLVRAVKVATPPAPDPAPVPRPRRRVRHHRDPPMVGQGQTP